MMNAGRKVKHDVYAVQRGTPVGAETDCADDHFVAQGGRCSNGAANVPAVELQHGRNVPPDKASCSSNEDNRSIAVHERGPGVVVSCESWSIRLKQPVIAPLRQ